MSVLISTEPFVFPIEANRFGGSENLSHFVLVFDVAGVDEVLCGCTVIQIVYDLFLLALSLPGDLFGDYRNLADSYLRNNSKVGQIMQLR